MNYLPDDVHDALLSRWRERHRRYHGETHLRHGLRVLDELGATDLERIAFWCHDAVHTATSPDDELASAELARRLLAPHLTLHEMTTVGRLVLVTIAHLPEPGDDAAARVSDADLAGLASPWEDYVTNLRGIRAEQPDVDDDTWRARRNAQLEGLLDREWVFHTAFGRERWEAAARANVARELDGPHDA